MFEPDDGDVEEVPHILFHPFATEETPFGEDSLDDYIGDVRMRLEFYFKNDEVKLRLAQMLISSCIEGGDVGVDGLLQVTHHDETLPPTAFDYDLAPQWFKDVAVQYRQNPPPSLPDNLRRLEEELEGTVKKAKEAYKMLREKLDVACGALEHYAQGDDGERARQALMFADLADEDQTGWVDV